MSLRSGGIGTWRESRDQVFELTGAHDPLSKKNLAKRIGEKIKSARHGFYGQLIMASGTSFGLLLSSGLDAAAGDFVSAAEKALAATGLGLIVPVSTAVLEARKESSQFEAQRRRGQNPDAQPLTELDRVEHEAKVGQDQLAASLRDQRRQNAEDLNEISNVVTEISETRYTKDEVFTKAELRQLVQEAVEQATRPLYVENQQLRERLAREETARQYGDANLQADVARVDADVSRVDADATETQARLTDTQAVTNDLTRGMNHVNDRLDNQARVVNQHAGTLDQLDTGLGGVMQVTNAHADNLDRLGRQQAGDTSRRGRRGDPTSQPPAPAARAHPAPPPPPGEPGNAATVPQEPWGAQQNQQPEPFPTAQRRQRGPQPGRRSPSDSPTPGPQPNRGPRPPRQ